MADWLAFSNTIVVSACGGKIPDQAGKYAFHVRSLDYLPEQFRNEADSRAIPTLLYIGKADSSLYERVWLQECQHRRPGTFFRSVGAMLGYRSPLGGRNYEFDSRDKATVVDWIASHLTLAWTTDPTEGSQRATEAQLIQTFAPLLNIQGNPRKFDELQRLRAMCRMGDGC